MCICVESETLILLYIVLYILSYVHYRFMQASVFCHPSLNVSGCQALIYIINDLCWAVDGFSLPDHSATAHLKEVDLFGTHYL